jgi:hypothetical protein
VIDDHRSRAAGNYGRLGHLRGRAPLQTPDRIPAEEMAAKIEAMVKPIFFTSSK